MSEKQPASQQRKQDEATLRELKTALAIMIECDLGNAALKTAKEIKRIERRLYGQAKKDLG